MHESKALCSEVKICVRFGVIFCKKVFTFAIIFSFFGGDFGEIFSAAVSGEVPGAICGCGFPRDFAVAWCNLGVLPVQ